MHGFKKPASPCLTAWDEFATIAVISHLRSWGGRHNFRTISINEPSGNEKTQKQVTTFLEKWLDKSIRQYVGAMDEENNGHLHELIMGGIEKPLVEIVLKETGGNQTQAANILGINRNTLRKKIAEYKIKCNNKT